MCLPTPADSRSLRAWPERRPLLHATTPQAAQQILRDGLAPRPSRYAGRTVSRDGHVYLATSFQTAAWYAQAIAEQHGQVTVLLIDDPLRLPGAWSADEDHFEHHPHNQVDADGNVVCQPPPPPRRPGMAAVGQAPVGALAYRHFRLSRPPRKGDPQTLAAWADTQPLHDPRLVRYSAQRGSLAYRGIVPADLIRLLVTLDREQVQQASRVCLPA